jgi:epoxide hydrolase-like predicted phosphatase
MPHPDAIIFDYGRVLVGPLDMAAFQADLATLAAERGFARGKDLWEHIYISEAWEWAKRGLITHEAFWADRLSAVGLQTQEGQHNFKMRLYRHWGLFPEMRVLLDQLRRRYRLAVLSNTSRRDFAHYLAEKRALGGFFQAVISSAEVGVAKPDPAIYRLALARLKAEPQQVLFIDDLERNTRAAEELGIATLLFTTPSALRSELREHGII